MPIWTPPKVELIGKIVAQSQHTGNTTETLLGTITVPAGKMGSAGELWIRHSWSWNNDASVKTARVRFNGIAGTIYWSLNGTTSVGGQWFHCILNRNATNSQIGGASTAATGGWGISTAALVTSAIDTTAAVDIAFTGELADGADNIAIEHATVLLIRG